MPSVGGTHHVKIGDHYCIIRPYSYSKRPAPLFGARVTSGDPDYNNLSIWQHWAQTCWVGGIDADQWTDDSMYDEAVGVDTTVHERISLSRDLTQPTGGALNAGSLNEPRQFFIFKVDGETNAKLYSITMPSTTGATDSYLWRWAPATSTWSLIKTWAAKRARSITWFNNKMVVGFTDGAIQHAADPAGAWTNVALPAGVTGACTALAVYQGKLYCAYKNQIWRRGTDFSVDGSTVFYKAEAADYVVEMTAHLGFLYMLSNNARVLRTDGNNTFDIWGWDSNTIGVSMGSYDGRLFLATYEYTDTADVGFGVLYQFSGSAVTQLKRFGAEGRATSLGQMIVYDRKLWFGASGLWGMNRNAAGTDLGGFGVGVYDAVEDSHSIWATQLNTTTYPDASTVGRDWMVDDLIFFQGYIHVANRKFGNFRTPLTYRDYLRARANYNLSTTAATGTANNGFLISSDYDGGTVGLKKLWKDITIHCDLPSANTNVGVDYSIDGGATWVSAGSVTFTAGTRYTKVLKLNNIRSNRFKYRLRLNSTVATQSPVVRGVIVSYLPLPEPNWMWDFVIVSSSKQELLDGTVETVDAKARMEYLESLFRGQQLFTFIDLDGVTWATAGPGVLLYDIQRLPAINGDPTSVTPLEGDVRVTLLEAVESY